MSKEISKLLGFNELEHFALSVLSLLQKNIELKHKIKNGITHQATELGYGTPLQQYIEENEMEIEKLVKEYSSKKIYKED